MFDIVAMREQLQADVARARATGSAVPLSQWVGLVGDCQGLVNTAQALQAVAVAHVAGFEDVALEDGTIGEEFRGLGHRRLDAGALVNDQLGLSASAAESRVEDAVTFVSRLPQLLDAMSEGRVDAYRAGVVVDELAEAGTDTCAEVLARLDSHLGTEPAAALRRRVRRVLEKVDADLLRAKAERARGERSLRRYAVEPGVDEWSARLPVEDSRVAWSVVDDVARRYVAEGRCAGIEQARAGALIDLVTGKASGAVTVHLAVPASEFTQQAESAGGTEGDMVAVAGFGLPGVTHVRRSWLAGLTGVSGRSAGLADGPPARTVVVACQDATGALQSGPITAATRTEARDSRDRAGTQVRSAARDAIGDVAASRTVGSYRPPSWMVDLVKARDGHCRFPGCSVNARFCDLDHVRPWPTGPTEPGNLVCLCRRHHRIKQSLRWHAELHVDGSMTWTDPTSRSRRTLPIDYLSRGPGSAAARDIAATELAGSGARGVLVRRGPLVRRGVVVRKGGSAGAQMLVETRDAIGRAALPSRLEEALSYCIDHGELERASRLGVRSRRERVPARASPHDEVICRSRPRKFDCAYPPQVTYEGPACHQRRRTEAASADEPPPF
jgi:hypothetical protein